MEYAYRIRDLKKHSRTFRKMYRELKRAEEEYIIESVGNLASGTYGEYDKSKRTLSISVTNPISGTSDDAFYGTSLQKIGHELGHAWRQLRGLDPERPTEEYMPVSVPWGTGPDYQIAVIAQNRTDEEQSLKINGKMVSSDEAIEIGGMEIENLVAGELIRSRRFKYSQFSYIKNNYGSRLSLVSFERSPGNAVVNPVLFYRINKEGAPGYDAFKNFSRKFFESKQNVHKMDNLKPLK